MMAGTEFAGSLRRVNSLHILGSRQAGRHPLDRFAMVDTRAETTYDDIAKLAQILCATPIAMVSLVYHDRQWFKARVGTLLDWIPRDVTFCDYAMREPDSILIVNDARKDPRFRDSPLVTGDTHACSYAGAPIVARDGSAVGAVCVVDVVPREFTTEQVTGLGALARQVAFLLELRVFLKDEREHHAASDNQARQLREDREQLERRHRDLLEVASHDALTGLLNRTGMQALRDDPAFMGRIERGPYCVALADVDQFKAINDRHGHPTGDASLRAVADAIRAELREGDRAGRYGGEEFLMVFPETGLADARKIIESIRQRIASLDLPAPVSLSIGLIEGMRHQESRLVALARADRALYEAKRLGGNQVSCGGDASR